MPADSAPAAASPPAPRARTIAVLATTQVLGWGTTYHLPVVFARPIADDLDIGYDAVFLGVTAFLLAAGIAGTRAGRAIDHLGAPRLMAAGSLLLAAGLVAVGLSGGLVSYLAGWAVLGLGCALALYNSAFVAIAQIMGPQARRTIGLMTLITVAAVLLTHPANEAMQLAFGWRTACLIYAALHVCVGLPLHLFALPARRDRDPVSTDPAPERFAPLPEATHGAAKVLFVLAYAFAGLIGWGLPLHMVTLFRDGGVDPVAAVWIAGLSGPAQAAARLIEITLGERNHPVTSAAVSFSLAPIAFLAMLVAPQSEAMAITFILLWGLSAGTVALTRASVPLVLFGRAGYGQTMGRLALPLTFVFALAPILFAWLIETGGPTLVIGISLALSLGALAAIIRLARLAGVPFTPLSPSRGA